MLRFKSIVGVLIVFLTMALRAADALKPSGKAREVDLASLTILLPQSPTPQEMEAARELQSHLAVITGQEPAVRRENETWQAPVISVGATGLAAQRAPFSGRQLGPEGYEIAVTGDGSVFLTGGAQRGPLFAAYAFLEEDLGVRWYSAYEETVYLDCGSNASVTPRAGEPAFDLFRDACDYSTNDAVFVLRNRLNPWRRPDGKQEIIPAELGGNFRFVGGVAFHTFDWFWRWHPDTVFAVFSEWFMVDANGARSKEQLCTSNPSLRAAYLKDVLNMLIVNNIGPGEVIGFSQHDSGDYCHCPACLKVTEEYGSTSAPLLDMANWLARKVREAGYDVKIMLLGYLSTRRPPAREMKMEPNITLFLTTDLHMVTKAQIPLSQSEQFVANLAAWKRMIPEFYIYDYPVFYANYHWNLPTLYATGVNYRFYRDNGARGIYPDSFIEGNFGDRQELRTWINAKLMFNPDLDVEALIEDFALNFYGAAGPDVLLWFKELYETGRKGLMGDPDYEAYLARSTALLDAAEQKLAAAGETGKLKRLKRLQISLRSQEIDLQFPRYKANGIPYPEEFKRRIADFRAMARETGCWVYGGGKSIDQRLDWVLALDELAVNEYTEPIPDGERIRLAGVWRFKFLGNPEVPLSALAPQMEEYAKEDFNADGWNAYLDTLGGWEEQGYPATDGTGFFRNRFSLTAPERFAHWYIVVPGLDEQGVMWINGKVAADHTEEATGLSIGDLWNYPVIAEITPFIRDGVNHIAMSCMDSTGMGGLYAGAWVIGSMEALSPRQLYALLPEPANPYGASAAFAEGR